jgi:hypothetical protein
MQPLFEVKLNFNKVKLNLINYGFTGLPLRKIHNEKKNNEN